MRSVCMTGNLSIKTEKLNNRHIPYPLWNCRSLKKEKLNDRHISYPSWNYRLLKVENDRWWPLHSSAFSLTLPVIKNRKTKWPAHSLSSLKQLVIKSNENPAKGVASTIIIIYLVIWTLFDVDDIFIQVKNIIAVQRVCMLINVNHTYIYI